MDENEGRDAAFVPVRAVDPVDLTRPTPESKVPAAAGAESARWTDHDWLFLGATTRQSPATNSSESCTLGAAL